MRSLIAIAALVLAAGLIAAGCGAGSSGTSAPSTASGAAAKRGGGGEGAGGSSVSGGESSPGGKEAGTISKAALLRRGDAVCAEGRERIAATAPRVLAAKAGEREDVEIELVSKVLVPVLETDVGDLEALGMPKGDEEEVSAIVGGIREVLALAQEEPQALVIPEDPSVNRPDPWRAADKRAEEYGFRECLRF